jgi:hypothetical protein
MKPGTVGLFIGGHVLAACSILAIATAVGGGWAGPPMPPLTAPAVAQATPATPDLRHATREPLAPAAPAADPRDLAAPWRTDADGRVRWRDD